MEISLARYSRDLLLRFHFGDLESSLEVARRRR